MTFSDDFSSDFDVADEPQDEPLPEADPDGPWISHGVVHLGHRPLNH